MQRVYPTRFPCVVAVLVVQTSEQVVAARASVDNFLKQYYPLKKLLIVNSSDSVVLTRKHELITEKYVDKELGESSLWSLRAYALRQPETRYQYVTWWQPEIWRHPAALAVQRGLCSRAWATTFQYQFRVDLTTGRIAVRDSNNGVSELVMFWNPGDLEINATTPTQFLASVVPSVYVLDNSKLIPELGAMISIGLWHLDYHEPTDVFFANTVQSPPLTASNTAILREALTGYNLSFRTLQLQNTAQ